MSIPDERDAGTACFTIGLFVTIATCFLTIATDLHGDIILRTIQEENMIKRVVHLLIISKLITFLMTVVIIRSVRFLIQTRSSKQNPLELEQDLAMGTLAGFFWGGTAMILVAGKPLNERPILLVEGLLMAIWCYSWRFRTVGAPEIPRKVDSKAGYTLMAV